MHCLIMICSYKHLPLGEVHPKVYTASVYTRVHGYQAKSGSDLEINQGDDFKLGLSYTHEH